jgi:arabinofuranan 3-O-arabinosyltransferase
VTLPRVFTKDVPAPASRLFVASLCIVFGYFVALGLMFLRHDWIVDAAGRPIPIDFLVFWATGQSALAGHAASAYDLQAQHAAEIRAVGYSFSGYFCWIYPPLFFFVAIPLALLPYTAAFLGWVVSTGAAFSLAIGAITRRAGAALYAWASPAVLFTAYLGQNGFLTAALIGGALLALESQPILGGVLLGFLTYKPQFGILIPVALVFGRHWRALASAMATTAVTVVASWQAFGSKSYANFLHDLPVMSRNYLTNQGESWTKIQSVYSAARVMGAGDMQAWVVQDGVILACAAAMMWLWRRPDSLALKAAGLVAASLLSTPYLHEYDFPVILVALAFLYRDRPFDRAEWAGVAATNLIILGFFAQVAPIGPAAMLIVLLLVARRVLPSAHFGAASAPGMSRTPFAALAD